MKSKTVRIIKKDNVPEWAVIPYQDYRRLQKLDKSASDVAHIQRVLTEKNAVCVWREYRGITQAILARTIGISASDLSQIENNEQTATVSMVEKLAEALNVSIEDLS